MSQGVSKQTTKIIDKNNSMRNVIYETASNIEFLLKEYYESLYPKKNNDKANVCLNSSILDDLPFDQQVEIYKNSISEIRKESPETKANRIYIENLQKQIERLKSNIYNQKMIKKDLEKVNQNFKRAFTNIKQDENSLNQNEKENELKMIQREYHEMKNEYKNSQLIIKKQVNSIIILEDNCKFIRENIEYAKYLKNLNKEENINDDNNDKNNEINDVQKKANETENLKRTLENKYLNKIKKQKEIMSNIIKKNEFIENKIKEYNKTQNEESILNGMSKNLNAVAKKKCGSIFEVMEKSSKEEKKGSSSKKNNTDKDDNYNSFDEKNKLIKIATQELNIDNNN